MGIWVISRSVVTMNVTIMNAHNFACIGFAKCVSLINANIFGSEWYHVLHLILFLTLFPSLRTILLRLNHVIVRMYHLLAPVHIVLYGSLPPHFTYLLS